MAIKGCVGGCKVLLSVQLITRYTIPTMANWIDRIVAWLMWKGNVCSIYSVCAGFPRARDVIDVIAAIGF